MCVCVCVCVWRGGGGGGSHDNNLIRSGLWPSHSDEKWRSSIVSRERRNRAHPVSEELGFEAALHELQVRGSLPR